jgi:transcriptional regulator with XRE-family HTH domain
MIGEKIKRFREGKNLSQEFVADYLGISQTSYSKIESNQTKLTAERISSLASLFDVPVFEFLPNGDSVVFNIQSATYAYINNFVESQKSTYESVIDILREQLKVANEEKATLYELLKKK